MPSSILLSDNGASSASAGLKQTAGNDGVLILQTTTSGGTATNAIYVDTSQNVGVGTSSPESLTNFKFLDVGSSSTNQGVLQANNGTVKTAIYSNGTEGYVATRTSHNLNFQTGGTTRATIDSSGNLLVGQTGADAKFVTNNSSASMPAGYVYSTNASFTNDNLRLKTDRAAGGNAFLQLAVFSSSTLVAFIRDNGNLANVNNSYGAISDIKLKENIVDATPKLEKLNQVRIVNYNLIGDTQKQIGVVAQELEQIFPGMVEESQDYEEVTTTDEDGNEKTERVPTGTTTKSVKYSVFVPMLIKAIQEQQAIITTLTQRVEALEGAK